MFAEAFGFHSYCADSKALYDSAGRRLLKDNGSLVVDDAELTNLDCGLGDCVTKVAQLPYSMSGNGHSVL